MVGWPWRPSVRGEREGRLSLLKQVARHGGQQRARSTEESVSRQGALPAWAPSGPRAASCFVFLPFVLKILFE